MTPFDVFRMNGQMKITRSQSRKSGRLAEKHGYRMRDDAKRQGQRRPERHQAAGTTSCFSELPAIQEQRGSESKMVLNEQSAGMVRKDV